MWPDSWGNQFSINTLWSTWRTSNAILFLEFCYWCLSLCKRYVWQAVLAFTRTTWGWGSCKINVNLVDLGVEPSILPRLNFNCFLSPRSRKPVTVACTRRWALTRCAQCTRKIEWEGVQEFHSIIWQRHRRAVKEKTFHCVTGHTCFSKFISHCIILPVLVLNLSRISNFKTPTFRKVIVNCCLCKYEMHGQGSGAVPDSACRNLFCNSSWLLKVNERPRA